MSNGYGFGGEDIKEESSWRYPLTIFFATLILCAIFLYHYVGPSGDEILGNTPKPTISDELIQVSIGGQSFKIPANHTVFPRDRRPGMRDALSLYAFWPTMSGYAPARRSDFVDNEPNSRRIDIQILKRKSPFSETERLEYLYLPQTLDKRGTASQYGLTLYAFKDGGTNTPTNGYASREMFLGQTATSGDKEAQIIVLFCYRETEAALPPDCYREYEVSDTVSVKYYFKRPYLPEWAKIDSEVRNFVKGLQSNRVSAELTQ